MWEPEEAGRSCVDGRCWGHVCRRMGPKEELRLPKREDIQTTSSASTTMSWNGMCRTLAGGGAGWVWDRS